MSAQLKFPKLVLISILSMSLFMGGCVSKPTFESDRIPQHIEEICAELYGLEAIGARNGSTIGVLYLTDKILDEEQTALSKETHELLGNLSQTVTRVALSTDVDVEFTVVTIRGRDSRLEFTIIRNLVDVKKVQTEAISMTESMNRTVFDQLRFDPESDIEGPFNLEDITMENFLSRQVLQRVRFAKPKDEDEEEKEKKEEEEPESQDPEAFPMELFDGSVVETAQGPLFDFSVISFNKEDANENMLKILRSTRDVLGGYHYDKFDKIVIRDLMNGVKLTIGTATLQYFLDEKITEEEIVNTRLTEDADRNQLFRNALEMMGFNVTAQ